MTPVSLAGRILFVLAFSGAAFGQIGAGDRLAQEKLDALTPQTK